MNEYEVFVEEINPCGGKKTVLEVEAENPETYVNENGRFPIMEKIDSPNGDVVIVTGDGNGYLVRYTFTK